MIAGKYSHLLREGLSWGHAAAIPLLSTVYGCTALDTSGCTSFSALRMEFTASRLPLGMAAVRDKDFQGTLLRKSTVQLPVLPCPSLGQGLHRDKRAVACRQIDLFHLHKENFGGLLTCGVISLVHWIFWGMWSSFNYLWKTWDDWKNGDL